MTIRVPTAAIVRPVGPPRSLVTNGEPDEEVTERQLSEAGYTVRLFMRILRDITALRRRVAPNRIDFEDIEVSSVGAYIRLPHGFGGRVRWWVVDQYKSTVSFVRSDVQETDKNTLVLYGGCAVGTTTCSIRVEEAG